MSITNNNKADTGITPHTIYWIITDSRLSFTTYDGLENDKINGENNKFGRQKYHDVSAIKIFYFLYFLKIFVDEL